MVGPPGWRGVSGLAAGGYTQVMVATYAHPALHEPRTWEAGETTCDGCGHRLAAKAARIVSLGPAGPDGAPDEPPRVFHRLQCALDYLDARTIRLGLQDL